MVTSEHFILEDDRLLLVAVALHKPFSFPGGSDEFTRRLCAVAYDVSLAKGCASDAPIGITEVLQRVLFITNGYEMFVNEGNVLTRADISAGTQPAVWQCLYNVVNAQARLLKKSDAESLPLPLEHQLLSPSVDSKTTKSLPNKAVVVAGTQTPLITHALETPLTLVTSEQGLTSGKPSGSDDSPVALTSKTPGALRSLDGRAGAGHSSSLSLPSIDTASLAPTAKGPNGGVVPSGSGGASARANTDLPPLEHTPPELQTSEAVTTKALGTQPEATLFFSPMPMSPQSSRASSELSTAIRTPAATRRISVTEASKATSDTGSRKAAKKIRKKKKANNRLWKMCLKLVRTTQLQLQQEREYNHELAGQFRQLVEQNAQLTEWLAQAQADATELALSLPAVAPVALERAETSSLKQSLP